jgi:ribosome-associated translation inhibitor RaiA
MMFTTTKTINGDLDISLPLETITAVLDVFNKIDCEIRVTNSALYVSNKFVDVVLALPDSRDAIDSSIVRDKAREALRFEGTVVELDKKEVTDFLANAKSVSDKSRPELQVRVEKGSVLLTVQTTIGTAKTKLAATTTADIDFRIDLEYFEEAIKKGKEVKFKYADSFIIVYCTDAYSLISLNQEV